jgi:hypothetical protein
MILGQVIKYCYKVIVAVAVDSPFIAMKNRKSGSN